MPRDPAKQIVIESRLRELTSRAYGNVETAVRTGEYRKNKTRKANTLARLNEMRRDIASRMASGNTRAGNQGKFTNLTTLIEIMNENSNSNSNSESDSPAVEHASAVAQKSAKKHAESAVKKGPKRKTYKVVAPKVNVIGGEIDCLVPGQAPYILKVFNTLLIPQIQKDLIGLYADSQAEFSKSGKLTQEIGMARERDMLAVLQEHLGDELRTDIDNSLVEDCLYGNARISIKHSSSQYGTGTAKAKWCSDESVGKAYIDKMVKLDPTNYTHLMIIYIDMNEKSKTKGTISIAFITDKAIMKIVEELRVTAFVLRTGTDTRGVEYSREMMVKMLDAAAFVIQMVNVNLAGGEDPIVRRRRLLMTRRARPADLPVEGRLGPGGVPPEE